MQWSEQERDVLIDRMFVTKEDEQRYFAPFGERGRCYVLEGSEQEEAIRETITKQGKKLTVTLGAVGWLIVILFIALPSLSAITFSFLLLVVSGSLLWPLIILRKITASLPAKQLSAPGSTVSTNSQLRIFAMAFALSASIVLIAALVLAPGYISSTTALGLIAGLHIGVFILKATLK